MNPSRSGRPVDEAEFERLFAEFRYTAFRLETLQNYAVDYEKEPLRRFLSGEPFGHSPILAEWGEEVGERTRAGMRYSRVHVVTEPLSDYVRFECAWAYRPNVTAGEDVRILPVADDEWPEGVPHWDYWLFDSATLLGMNYTPDGEMLAGELIEDPELIVSANLWRDRTVHLSVPFAEYETRFDAAMRPR